MTKYSINNMNHYIYNRELRTCPSCSNPFELPAGMDNCPLCIVEERRDRQQPLELEDE